jgi:thiol-disulfide isomerase/thioredoxin
MSWLNFMLLGMVIFYLIVNRCGHCKSLKPTYEKLAQAFTRESNCVVAALDGDKYGDFMARFNIQGFPTLKFFPKGSNKAPMDYKEGRDLSSFVKYLNEFCGTHRDENGDLTEKVCYLDGIYVFRPEELTSWMLLRLSLSPTLRIVKMYWPKPRKKLRL